MRIIGVYIKSIMTPTEFLNRYQYDPKTDKLGSYNGGVVYKAYDRASRRDVAIKAVVVKEQPDENDFSLKDDFAALQTVPQHRNIANYESLYTLETSKGLYDFAIMPYFKDGNLAQQIQLGMSNAAKSQLAQELLEGLSLLHSHKIVHCDLRPANILTIRKPKEVIPLIAFGMGMSYEPSALRFRAPEMLTTSRIHFCIDLWSYGVIIYELFTGKSLFAVGDDETEESMYQKIMSTDWTNCFAELPLPWRKIVERCLVVDPVYRAQNTRELFDILSQPVEEDALPLNSLVKDNVEQQVSEQKDNEEVPTFNNQDLEDNEMNEKGEEVLSEETEEKEVSQNEEVKAEKASVSSLLFNLAEVAGIEETSDEGSEPAGNEEPEVKEEPPCVSELSPEKKEEEVKSVRYWGTELAAQEAQKKASEPQKVPEPQSDGEEEDDKLPPSPMETDPFLPLNVEDDTKVRRIALIAGIVVLVLLAAALLWMRHSKKMHLEQAVEDTTALFEQPKLMLEDVKEVVEKEFPSRTKPLGEDGTSCGELTDVDGNAYATVKIGSQCWMKENLRTTHTPSGGEMIVGKTHNFREKLYYPQSNYGYLYNWTAATNGELSHKKGKKKETESPSGNIQGICPEGWHIPSKLEWQELSDYVATNYAFSGDKTYIGKPLAASKDWRAEETPNTVGHNASLNNVTGFSALPAGSYCDYYLDSRQFANFWSATPGEKGAYCLTIGYDSKEADLHTDGKDIGYSVRCLKDNL